MAIYRRPDFSSRRTLPRDAFPLPRPTAITSSRFQAAPSSRPPSSPAGREHDFPTRSPASATCRNSWSAPRTALLISRNVGVTVASSGTKNGVEHVYFSRLGDQKVLAVLVTRSGLVRDRYCGSTCRKLNSISPPAHHENFRGWTMGVHAGRTGAKESSRSAANTTADEFHRAATNKARGFGSWNAMFSRSAANLVTGQKIVNAARDVEDSRGEGKSAHSSAPIST